MRIPFDFLPKLWYVGAFMEVLCWLLPRINVNFPPIMELALLGFLVMIGSAILQFLDGLIELLAREKRFKLNGK